MEPAKKLQKISHRHGQKITITAFPLETDQGIEHVFACSVCKHQFKSMSLATTHIAEHKKRVKDQAGAGESGNIDSEASCRYTVQGECTSSQRVLKRNLDGCPKQDDCLQAGLEDDCIVVGMTSINRTNSGFQSTKDRDESTQKNCDSELRKLLTQPLASSISCNITSENAGSNVAPNPAEKRGEDIPVQNNETLEYQVNEISDSCSDDDDSPEAETEITKENPKEKAVTAVKTNKYSSVLIENAQRKAALPKYRCRQCALAFTELSCCICHIVKTHAKVKLFKTKNSSSSSVSVCGRIPCGKKHALSYKDVEMCKNLLEDANAFSKDLKSGGAEKLDESVLTKPNNDHTDIKTQRLQCLQRYFDFDKSLYTRDKRFQIGFDKISACSKEEISNDMVHRIERTDQGYECAICFEQFLEYGCCKSHVLTTHGVSFLYPAGSEVFSCPVCAVSFHSIYRFDQHLEFHGVFKYCCKKCNLLFNNLSIYQKHLKHAKPEILTNTSHSCSTCGLIHNCMVLEGEQERIRYNSNSKASEESKKMSNSRIQFHNSTYNPRGLPRSKQKEICGRIGFDGNSFVCLECKKTYDDFDCCSSHIVIQHVNLYMTCLMCNKLFYNRRSLNSHLKTDHQLRTFLYCACCFESFTVESELTKHWQNCTDKRSNKVLENRVCKNCCQLHVDTGITWSDVNECLKCQNGFLKLACYKNHYYREHFQGQVVLLSNYSRFQCPGGRQFLKLNSVYKHIHEVHLGIKNGMTSQETDRSSQLDLPLPEESMDGDFDVELKEKHKCKSENRKGSRTSNGLDHCNHCKELHVVQSQEVQMGSSSSKNQCQVCKVKFKSVKCLKNHLAVEHGGKRVVCQCLVCSKWFSSLKLLELHQGRAEHGMADSEKNNPEPSVQSVTDAAQGDVVTERRIICTIGIPIEGTRSDGSKAKRQSSVSVDRSAEVEPCERQLKTRCANSSKLTCSDCSTVHVNKFDKTEKAIINGNIFDLIDIKFEKQRSRHNMKSVYLENSCCTVCGEECGSMTDLYNHIIEVHVTMKFAQGEFTNDSKESYSCSYCPEKFRCTMDGQLHLKAYHCEKPVVIIRNKEPKKDMNMPGPVMCPVCFVPRDEVGTGSIPKHIKTHFKDLVMFVCDICGKSYSNNIMLKNHVSAKHTEQPTQHICTVCGKTFKFDSNLWCHMKSHMEKKEACPVCGMKFTLPAHVRAHVKRKH